MKEQLSYKNMAVVGLLIAIGWPTLIGCEKREPLNFSLPDCRNCNVILISLDTLRADHLGVYGYYRNTSPTIDALAQESIVFHNAYANAYFTLPSHMSIFTSTYPTRHQINYQRYDSATPQNNTLSESIWTMAQILNQSDYRTIWIAPFTDPHLERERGFGKGFGEFHSTLFMLDTTNSTILRDHFGDFLRQLNKSPRDPFFWFLHSYVLHAPYIQPSPYSGAFMSDNYSGLLPTNYTVLFEKQLGRIRDLFAKNASELQERLSANDTQFEKLRAIVKADNASALQEYRLAIGRPIYDRAIGYLGTIYYDLLRDDATPDEIEELRAKYDSGILYMDFQLGIFLDELRKADLWNNTIIILTSDHGDELYEHQGFDHANFYDHTVHVPLIIRVPDMEKKMEIDELTQSLDILPTLLRILGIDAPPSIQGKDMLSVVEGKQEPNAYVYGFSRGNLYIRSPGWKYMLRNSGKDELYYLTNDPQEQHNLINVTERGTATMREKLRTNLLEWSELT